MLNKDLGTESKIRLYVFAMQSAVTRGTANIYLFKINNKNTRKRAKYVRS